MKAIVQSAYGPPEQVLELREVEPPVPGPGEVLVRVRAASVHPDVWHVVAGLPYALRLMGAGLRRPLQPIPGTDVSGEVAALGPGAGRFAVGDAVFGESVRGHQWKNGGAWAQYAAVPEGALEPKPAHVSFEQAAAVPTSGFIALSTLREGRLAAGQRVLVNGAGGGVGAFAVQIARARGAHVTAVDVAAKLPALEALGADAVLDCARHDFTSGGERWDLVLDIPGNHALAAVRRALAPGGLYVLVGHDHYGRGVGRWFGSLGRFFGLLAMSPFVSYLPGVRTGDGGKSTLVEMRELLEQRLVDPLVDRVFSLGEAGAALRHLEQGSVLGKVVLAP